MNSVFKKALSLLTGQTVAETQSFKVPKNRKFKHLTERKLLNLESEIGTELFGEVPAGVQRDFFCLDASTWIWHEESPDPVSGKIERVTTRYEVHSNGILKVQEGARYSYLEGAELANFVRATRIYYERVARQVYRRDPYNGQALA